MSAPGLLLRLAGPLQSWGSHSHYNERDTNRFPTRSGVIGLLAAALGRQRHEPLDDLRTLSMTVRVDRSGLVTRDYHTVGGGLSGNETVVTVKGGRREQKSSTLVSNRYYLADAAFTVALTSADDELLATCRDALDSPRWPLYLGRRSCPPDGPVLLGYTREPLRHLARLPLAGSAPGVADRRIEFYSDHPLDALPSDEAVPGPDADDGRHTSGEISDEPLSFLPLDRRYRARHVYRQALRLPRTPYAGRGVTQLRVLRQYIDEHLGQPERSSR